MVGACVRFPVVPGVVVVGFGGSGGRGCGVVLVELGHVGGEVRECPLAAGGVQAAAAEAADPVVVLAVAEDE